MKMHFFTVVVALLQISILNAGTSGISVNARFEPTEANLYQEIRYIVDITRAFPHDFSPPNIPGLRRRSESVYQSSTMVNGISSQKVSFVFSFIPEKTGIIEMPEYTIEADGDRYPVMPAKVKILENPNVVSQQKNQEILLDVSMDQRRAYVGQNIPVKISVYLNKNVQLLNPISPQNLNDAFLLSSFSKQPVVTSDRGYEVYSWDATAVPLKSGNHQFTLVATCPIQFLRSIGFFSIAEQESVQLNSVPIAVEVLPLPNPPADFHGGVGQFSFNNLRLSSDRALVGEPITLSVDIVGTGNFTRLQPPKIANNEQWKCFSPKATFIANGDCDFRGTKTIDYVIVPQKTGEIAVPDITLTYFNPETGRFENSTIDNSQKIVLVSRSSDAFSDDAGETASGNEVDRNNKSKNRSAIHPFSKDTHCYTTLTLLYGRRWFWILQGCLAIIALLFLIKTCAASAGVKKLKWNIKAVEKRLTQAANIGNVEQFYSLSKQFIAQKLMIYSIFTKQRSEQIKQLRELGIKHLGWLESFFNEVDAIAFGRSQVDRKHIDQQLEKLLMFLRQQ
jgi:hypothetical protein